MTTPPSKSSSESEAVKMSDSRVVSGTVGREMTGLGLEVDGIGMRSEDEVAGLGFEDCRLLPTSVRACWMDIK